MVNKISILLLCGDTNRAKAYLRILSQLTFVDVKAILYGVDCIISKEISKLLDRPTSEYLHEIGFGLPDFDNSTKEILDACGINYVQIPDRDVNSLEVLSLISQFDSEYVIFAGYAGQILGRNHFLTEKKYIHCHPGWLPLERGSTTIYYSLLNNRPPSVTAFFMSEEIDKGEIIVRKSFSIPKNKIDFDFFADSALRAVTLKTALQEYLKKGHKQIIPEGECEEEYYVIHPLLKNISLLKIGEQ